METCMFCALMFKIYTKAQINARFQAFSSFSASFYSPLHLKRERPKGSIVKIKQASSSNYTLMNS